MEALILGVSFIIFLLVLKGCQKVILQKNSLSVEAGSLFALLPVLSMLPLLIVRLDMEHELSEYLSLGYFVPCIAFAIVGTLVSGRLFKKMWRFKILAALNLLLVAVYVMATLKATYAIGF